MKLNIITVGEPKLAYAKQGWEEYLKRLQRFHQVRVTRIPDKFAYDPIYISNMVGKVERVRRMLDQVKPGCDLEVDGGIDDRTAPLAVKAGANVLVAGSSIYHAADGVAAAMQRLRASVS